MNNPFERIHNEELKAEKDARRLLVRTRVLLLLFCAVLVGFFVVLFQTQIVHGEDYLDNTVYRFFESESMDSVRGELLDRYGRVLVTNEAGYNVELDVERMGNRRNEILLRLLDLCREENVVWAEALPISQSAPWTYTSESPFTYQTEGEDGETITRLTYLGLLAQKCEWVEDPYAVNVTDPKLPGDPDGAVFTAQELLETMCGEFGIDLEDRAPTTEDRDLAGVLYAIYLRLYEINNNTYVFASDVDITFITKVKENGLSGVNFKIASTRRYNTSYAAHVLGRVARVDENDWPTFRELGYPYNSVVGKQGVELAFESWLHGTSGTRIMEKDENDNIISQEWRVEPEPGDNVVLTLDMPLQAAVEDLLAQYAAGLEDAGGSAAVVLNMTGEVLALASYPTYDLSTYAANSAALSQDEARPLWNRATQGTYPPGSTFKMVTATAALTEGIITTRETVRCTGIYHYYDISPVCWIYTNTRGNHGLETVSEAITDSCNIFFYDVGQRLGINKLVEYASKFGLGQYTGIEIAERQGYVAGPETSTRLNQMWYGGDVLSAAIGQQNNLFSPLQLANYVATLVNGGNRYQVHLLKEVKSSDYSQTVYEFEPNLLDTIDIAEDDLAAIKLGMYNLSKTASMARYFSSLPVEVGCKTGTAEVGKSTANAIFVCFAPYENPEVAICLYAERGASGGSLAQVAAGILAQYFSTGSSLGSVSGENTLLR